MPFIWLIMLTVCSVYAFTPRETMAQYLPLAETTGGWIVGITVLFIGTIIMLLVFKLAQARQSNAMYLHGLYLERRAKRKV